MAPKPATAQTAMARTTKIQSELDDFRGPVSEGRRVAREGTERKGEGVALILPAVVDPMATGDGVESAAASSSSSSSSAASSPCAAPFVQWGQGVFRRRAW